MALPQQFESTKWKIKSSLHRKTGSQRKILVRWYDSIQKGSSAPKAHMNWLRLSDYAYVLWEWMSFQAIHFGDEKWYLTVLAGHIWREAFYVNY